MEDEESRRGSSGARRQRTDSSRRRPHSQPERLLSVSCRNSSDSIGSRSNRDPAPQFTGKAEGEKVVKVFKRRESSSRAPAPAADESKISKLATKSTTPTPKPNACPEKWAPKLKGKQPAEAPESKKRRQRLILEGSDDEEGSDSTRKEPPKEDLKASGEGLALRKSSRVVKRRTFDDEIDFDEVVRRRKKPVQEISEKISSAKQPEAAQENSDASEGEQPRKKPRKGSIQELQKEKPGGKQKVASVQENSALKEKRTPRQKALKEPSVSEQPSSSFRDEVHQAAESPGDSVESVEKANSTPLTARQRSLQACKDGDGSSHGFIEFPEGLNGTDRRRKPKLTDEEKLAKKAEAANKRKQQVEKAAKEIQASAIQKILNQDSNRKKREEKLQKQKQELAEERKAAELETATNSIRWVMGPSGTTVSWSQDAQIPSLFSGPISYPAPRVKCAACDNVYKYRDSKSNLPLCSLECYKTIREPRAVAEAH